jgi:Asp-tRNA(Asn)/Glu-tRNA(Gln) amidotransferase C subunit
MSDALTLIEAALFQLKAAAADVDPMYASQMQLTTSMLMHAVDAARQGTSPATVNDIAFALNDLAGVVRELNAVDADRVEPIVKLLQDDVARLKESTALPAAVSSAIRAFQSKLKARRAAIERQTYRPQGAPPEELPHAPQELQREAIPLRQQLAAGGFATPALDGLIGDPSSLRFHSITEILNELDVIVG